MSFETSEPTPGGRTEGVLSLGVDAEAGPIAMEQNRPAFLNRIISILPFGRSSEPMSLADTLRVDIQKTSRQNGVRADPNWN